MSTKIILDLRGEHISLYIESLIKISYFKDLKGEEPYFVDCDADVFREILSYTEFGIFRRSKYEKLYLRKVMDKLGVQYDFKDFATETELIEYQEQQILNLVTPDIINMIDDGITMIETDKETLSLEYDRINFEVDFISMEDIDTSNVLEININKPQSVHVKFYYQKKFEGLIERFLQRGFNKFLNSLNREGYRFKIKSDCYGKGYTLYNKYFIDMILL